MQETRATPVAEDTEQNPAAVDEKVDSIACASVLLVATDYDGTLAPIVENPDEATPDPEAMVALRALAALPNTHVAVVSGRALAELAKLTGRPDKVHLVGSHGSEFDLGFAESLSPQATALRERLIEDITDIVDGAKGFGIEVKPASVAFHFRNAPEEHAQQRVARVLTGPASLDGVFIKHGKKVIELAVVPTSKGSALDRVRRQVGATTCVFFGDDKTDEDAFSHLAPRDMGVKVGAGATIAGYRVADTRDVARKLARISERRTDWLCGAGAKPIEGHNLLSDQRSLALVDPDGRIAWMCAPRLDSPAMFAELLGGPGAGYFSITPVDQDAKPTQSYDDASFILQTRWPGLTVTDYLDASGGRVNQRPGRSDLLRVLEGRCRVRVEFAPRLDFSRISTRLTVRPGGLVVEDTVDPIVLHSPGVHWTIEQSTNHDTAVAEFDLDTADNEPVTLELRYGTGSLAPSVLTQQRRREQTRRLWSAWASSLDVPDLRPDLIRRSALAIRGLVHGPTGAIAAAATTSLPEGLGGVRNWDYRYCWPRDAAMAASALVRLGSMSEALRLLDWLLGVVDGLHSPDRLRPIYTVSGHDLSPEAEIPELAGYAGSRPVRVGNGAAGQLQLDVFGPIVELTHLLMHRGAPLSGEHWRLVEHMANAVAARWTEADHGIWEVRGPQQHHVHSKVMCWETVRLAAQVSEGFLGRPREDWLALADEIKRDVLQNGYNPKLNAFTGVYGQTHADAAVLTIGLCGMIDPMDDKFLGTVRFIERELLHKGTVYRYLCDDGLPGKEGGFNLCTAWLIEAYALCGRTSDAERLFGTFCELAGPSGMIPEQVDPETGLGLGNSPQAYSHMGLINAALRLTGRWR